MSAVEGVKLKVLRVPVGTLHPNPWNPNRQDERTYKAERESIRTFGFVDPVLVRPHPDLPGEWQIIDGEHRWRAAKDEGMEEIDVIPRVLTDSAARKLTVILNETRGNPDVALLGKLLAELEREMSEDELRVGLPYGDAELEHLLAVGRVEWDTFNPEPPPDPPDPPTPPGEHDVTLHYDADGAERYRNFVGMVRREKEQETDEEAVLWALRHAAESF